MSVGPHTLSEYRLLSRLGSGGMANVYLALASRPSGFNKLQVLKIMRTDLEGEDEQYFLQMFEDEARLAARLNHPNIVQAHEIGFDSGHPFLAMEYLDGQSLYCIQTRAWDDGRALPLEMQIHVLCQVLEALEYAHTLTDYDGSPLCIVHRDVSPQNVFVTYAGQTKLVDFGIAKTLQSGNTRTGTIKGKVGYISPEQITGDPIDARADLFSVGVMLWEAVAAQPMHAESTVFHIMNRVVLGELPDIADVVPNPPEALRRILGRALATKPADRYQHAATFRLDLTAFLESLPRVESRDVGERVQRMFEPERAEINTVIRQAMAGDAHPGPRADAFVETDLRRLASVDLVETRPRAVNSVQPSGMTEAWAALVVRKRSLVPVISIALVLLAGAGALALRPWDSPEQASAPPPHVVGGVLHSGQGPAAPAPVPSVHRPAPVGEATASDKRTAGRLSQEPTPATQAVQAELAAEEAPSEAPAQPLDPPRPLAKPGRDRDKARTRRTPPARTRAARPQERARTQEDEPFVRFSEPGARFRPAPTLDRADPWSKD